MSFLLASAARMFAPILPGVSGLVSTVTKPLQSLVSPVFHAIGGVVGAGKRAFNKVGGVVNAGLGAASTGLGLLSSPIVWIGGAAIVALVLLKD